MIFAAIPPISELRGRVCAPPSKSFTNRALLLAALSPRPFLVRGPLACEDSAALLGALGAAGVAADAVAEGLRLHAGAVPSGEIRLDVGDSGTACRFLTAFAATAGSGEFLLTGSQRLCQRPVGGLVDALLCLGAEIRYMGAEGFPPLSIRGRRLAGGAVSVAADQSSQFASALLLVAPRLDRGLSLSLKGEAVSRAYLASTCEALSGVGVEVRRQGESFEVPGGAELRQFEMRVPGDYSSALPLAGAVAVAGGELELANLDWPSTQADAAAFPVLQAMGVAVDPGPGGILVRGRAHRAVSCVASSFPDAVPSLAAVAGQVEGESVFSGIEHLRLKESDRIEAIADLLAAAGISSNHREGKLSVFGRQERGGTPPVLPTRGDHRLVMAASLLSLRGGALVEAPRSVGKSYPDFFRDLFR